MLSLCVCSMLYKACIDMTRPTYKYAHLVFVVILTSLHVPIKVHSKAKVSCELKEAGVQGDLDTLARTQWRGHMLTINLWEGCTPHRHEQTSVKHSIFKKLCS